MLIQKLLDLRDQCVLIYKKKIYCSCGKVLEDLLEAENHLVMHERLTEKCDFPEEKYVRERFIQFANSMKSKSQSGNGYHEPKLDIPHQTFLVILPECEIKSGQSRDISCQFCNSVVNTFEELEKHFNRAHPGRFRPPKSDKILTTLKELGNKKRLRDWTLRFHCPIPGCKYHAFSEEGKQFCTSLKLLKQHYAKVHVPKAFSCSKCGEKFAYSGQLSTHTARGCGKAFECHLCGLKYSSSEALQTHKRRKGHFYTEQKKFNLVPNVKIAAIALSELSTPAHEPSVKRKKTDNMSIQTEAFRNETTVTTMTSSVTLCNSSTSTHENELNYPESSASAPKGFFSSDQPLWTASGTQTSPPYKASPLFEEEDELMNVMSHDRAPRLSEIEQLSTETQTDLDILCQNDDDFEFNRFIEAETQFDLDDILCSNYTQTGLPNELYDSSFGVTSQTTMETQTPEDPEENGENGKFLFMTNVETQTH